MLSSIYTFILLYIYISGCVAQSSRTKWSEETPACIESGIIDINNLGFQLLNKAIVQPGNVFLTPIGLAWSLAILYGVSSNETAKTIGKLLTNSKAANLDPSTIEEEFAQLFKTLKESKHEFHISNQVHFKDTHKISDEFKKALSKLEYADIKDLFDKEEINQTENDTKNNSGSPRIELINSASFNDSWKIQFIPNKTERDYFYSGKRETTEVWMMTVEAETYKFFEDLEMRYKFIELPYEKGDRSMILGLPTLYDQPANLQLDAQAYCEIKSKMIPTKLDMVSLPKFHFNDEYSFSELLTAFGLANIFNDTASGIGDDEVYVSDVKQKIKIEVDEDGGESAATTKLKFKPVAFRGVKEFIANHPFTFYIEDLVTGNILLSGRIDEPSESISFSERLNFSK